MSYDVNKEIISVNSTVFEGCRELPVDLDLNLPDYCPDIQKILKCSVTPKITSRNILGDRLNIEGFANVKLIYVDSDKKAVRCCENSEPFSFAMDLKVSPENAVAVTSSKVEYMNCRAVNPRRVDVHGAIAICAKIYNKDNMEISSTASGEDIQQKKSEVSVSNLSSVDQQQFSINEMLDLGQNKPVPEIIVRSDASLILDDCKSMVNKVMIKGEATVKILYVSDPSSNNMEVMEFSIPFSQVMDVPGAQENSKCEIILEMLGHDEQIRNESTADSNLISEEIKACATVFVYNDENIEIIEDVYSTQHDLECTSGIVKLCRLCDVVKSSCSVKSSVEFTEFNISRVVDVWIDTCSINSKYENGSILYDGKASICVLAVDLEETPFYIERAIDISCTKSVGKDWNNITVNSFVSPLSIGYRITGSGSIEVKADFKFISYLYSCEKLNMIESIDILDDEPKAKESDVALTIYYAKPGERIWDIAKKYYTCVDEIKEQNDIKEEVINQEKAILIPM